MPCGRAAREEEAYRAENRNVPDRSASDDARRHIIDRPIYTRNRLSPPLLLLLLLPSPSPSLSPVSSGGLRGRLGRDASRWLSRASLARRGPEKPNLKTHTDNWG